MTPPKKVDIHSLDSLYLENLIGLEPNEAAKRFKGSDLVLDTTTGELKKTGKDASNVDVTSLDQEAAWVKTIREADGGVDGKKDGYIDISEVKKMLSTLPAEASGSIDPEKFLASIEKLMKDRYDPLATNMKGWKAALAFKPTLDALDLYNKGVLSADTQQAGATIAFNSLTKTAANIGGFVSYPFRRIGGTTDVLWGDMKARESAKKDYEKRQAVIDRLKAVIDKGVAANESWAIEGKLDEALKKVSAEDAKVLNDQLAATKINGILNIEDPKERYKQMMDFAKNDRPGGFYNAFWGKGNTNGDADFWNYSGHRYNTYFARTVLRFLGTKAASGDGKADDVTHTQARQMLADSQGDGGGFGNLAAVGLTGLGCGIGYGVSFGHVNMKTCVTDPRDWSDEDTMDALGRGIDGAIMVFGGNKFLGRLGEARKLAGFKGVFTAEGVLGTWKGAMAESLAAESKLSKYNPMAWNWLGGGKWAEAANSAEKEAEALGLAGKATQEGRFWKLMNKWADAKTAMKEWIFKGVPLSAEQKALAEKMAKSSSKGMDKLTKGVILLGIVQYGDSKLSAPFNPFEQKLDMGWMNREANFERYDDPTKPDATLNAPKK